MSASREANRILYIRDVMQEDMRLELMLTGLTSKAADKAARRLTEIVTEHLV